MTIVVIVGLIVLGVVTLVSAIANWDWFFRLGKAGRAEAVLGRRATRVLYAFIGAALIFSCVMALRQQLPKRATKGGTRGARTPPSSAEGTTTRAKPQPGPAEHPIAIAEASCAATGLCGWFTIRYRCDATPPTWDRRCFWVVEAPKAKVELVCGLQQLATEGTFWAMVPGRFADAGGEVKVYAQVAPIPSRPQRVSNVLRVESIVRVAAPPLGLEGKELGLYRQHGPERVAVVELHPVGKLDAAKLTARLQGAAGPGQSVEFQVAEGGEGRVLVGPASDLEKLASQIPIGEVTGTDEERWALRLEVRDSDLSDPKP